MLSLPSLVGGRWQAAAEAPEPLLNPATEEILGEIAAGPTDRHEALRFAREQGGPALRELTFQARGELLQAVADALLSAREELIAVAVRNGGNTRGDAKFDVDGAIATLAAYAAIGRELGEERVLLDGERVALGRTSRLSGQHLFASRHGVAVHINAFNFPAWGLAEKAAVAWLAGMPVLTKPATSSALVAHRIVEMVHEGHLLPDGALSVLLGPPGDLLGALEPQDVVAFTGSGATAIRVRSHPTVIRHAVRLNVEADSLNAAILGPDVAGESETYALFLKDVVRDMTQKAGQKCTAIRRVLVPVGMRDRVAADLVERLQAVVVGDPMLETVRMGPLATRAQLEHVQQGTKLLAREGTVLFAAPALVPLGVPPGRGFFVSPTLLEAPLASVAVHEREVFGPVATLLSYPGERPTEAMRAVVRGGGALVASLYSDDETLIRNAALDLAPFHGRLFIGSGKIAEVSPGPGTVLPSLVHGGPGHAGGGEELGGLRALHFYMQRVALEGPVSSLERIFRAQ